MTKRMYEREDISRERIPIAVTTNGQDTIIGFVKDISEIGLSFYSYNHEVIPQMGKFVHIAFPYNGQRVLVELEILRELHQPFGFVSGGKFIGIASKLRTFLPEQLAYAEAEQLVCV